MQLQREVGPWAFREKVRGRGSLHQRVREGLSEVLTFEPRCKRCTGQTESREKGILVRGNSSCEGRCEWGRAWHIGGLKVEWVVCVTVCVQVCVCVCVNVVCVSMHMQMHEWTVVREGRVGSGEAEGAR